MAPADACRLVGMQTLNKNGVRSLRWLAVALVLASLGVGFWLGYVQGRHDGGEEMMHALDRGGSATR